MQPFHREVVVEGEFVQHYKGIDCSGISNATVVVVKTDKGWFCGAALCSDKDTWNRKRGIAIARGRAIKTAHTYPDCPDLTLEEVDRKEEVARLEEACARFLDGELQSHEEDQGHLVELKYFGHFGRHGGAAINQISAAGE